jgi:hypothetical protein
MTFPARLTVPRHPSLTSSLHLFPPLQPAVPETTLKRRKRDEAWASKKAAAAAEAEAKKAANKKEIFNRAEKYVKEYRDQVSARIPASRGRLAAFSLGSGSSQDS